MASSQVSFTPKYLHPIKTKQSFGNIRFLTQDGLLTYFQKNSGSLLMAKGYKTQIVFSDSPNTQYLMKASPYGKKIIVTKDKLFYSFLNLNKKFDIFTLDYGKVDAQLIGQGRFPKLHLEDSWISFYEPKSKTLVFQELENDQKKYSLSLSEKTNIFFKPSTLMLSDKLILFTQLNAKGAIQVIIYYPHTKRQHILYQNPQPGKTIKLCLLHSKIIINEFSKGRIHKGSTIMSLDSKRINKENQIKTIYNSPTQDLGQALCLGNKVWFLKEREQPKQIIKNQDIYSLNIQTGQLTQHSKRNNIEQIFSQDSQIFAVKAGEFYILKDNPYKNIKKSILEDF